MSHAFKTIPESPREPVSFVKAVTECGDNWTLGLPLWAKVTTHIGLEERTSDWSEATSMRLMEQGHVSRVGHIHETGSAIVTSFDYPPIPERCFDWSAVREDYCGCGECRHPTGHGRTKFEAIADLLEQEEP